MVHCPCLNHHLPVGAARSGRRQVAISVQYPAAARLITAILLVSPLGAAQNQFAVGRGQSRHLHQLSLYFLLIKTSAAGPVLQWREERRDSLLADLQQIS